MYIHIIEQLHYLLVVRLKHPIQRIQDEFAQIVDVCHFADSNFPMLTLAREVEFNLNRKQRSGP
jgi:hypothetical protein